jgi:transposase-like protein
VESSFNRILKNTASTVTDYGKYRNYTFYITIYSLYLFGSRRKDKTMGCIVKETPITNLMQLLKRFPTEESCREYLEQSRWQGKPVCPHCGSSDKFYRIKGGRLFKCAKCRRPFSVKIGTIFEDSALPLQKWFHAIFVVSAYNKGISSCQLAKDISVRQATAWHMLHRIRLAMATESYEKPLKGIEEIDETFVCS